MNNKDLLSHRAYIKAKVEEFTKRKNPNEAAIMETYQYHIDRVRDFQHERLIHLLVTFFFGFLLLVSIAGLFVAVIANISSSLTILVSIVTAILFITELFYIRHYYRLENGTQSLYILTRGLRTLLEK